MICRHKITEEYKCFDGELVSEAMEKKRVAIAEAYRRLNEWVDDGKKIITILEDGYFSMNTDNGPFWFSLTVIYDDGGVKGQEGQNESNQI